MVILPTLGGNGTVDRDPLGDRDDVDVRENGTRTDRRGHGEGRKEGEKDNKDLHLDGRLQQGHRPCGRTVVERLPREAGRP
jgi:hypothetical protein